MKRRMLLLTGCALLATAVATAAAAQTTAAATSATAQTAAATGDAAQGAVDPTTAPPTTDTPPNNGEIVMLSFAPVAHDVSLFAPFIRAGLITLGPDGKPVAWRAMPWLAGGTVPIVLADPDDPALVARARGVLDAIAADPVNGVDRILDWAAIAQMGGPVDASFIVAFKPGYEGGRDPAAPPIAPSTYRGMHGYLPDDPAMRSTLIVAGPAVAKHGSLGLVDMRAIAPSIGRVLGIRSPVWEMSPTF